MIISINITIFHHISHQAADIAKSAAVLISRKQRKLSPTPVPLIYFAACFVCVCVCVCARACVCVCARARACSSGMELFKKAEVAKSVAAFDRRVL